MTSDLAVFSRKGSQLVRRYRLEKERRKAQQKHWELAGSRLGDVLGIKQKEEDKVCMYGVCHWWLITSNFFLLLLLLLLLQDTAQRQDGSTNYKSGQQFSTHIQSKSQAVSMFAKSKSIKQQREFLPIFAVRDKVGLVCMCCVSSSS